jgi:hypothetical protein
VLCSASNWEIWILIFFWGSAVSGLQDGRQRNSYPKLTWILLSQSLSTLNRQGFVTERPSFKLPVSWCSSVFVSFVCGWRLNSASMQPDATTLPWRLTVPPNVYTHLANNTAAHSTILNNQFHKILTSLSPNIFLHWLNSPFTKNAPSTGRQHARPVLAVYVLGNQFLGKT